MKILITKEKGCLLFLYIDIPHKLAEKVRFRTFTYILSFAVLLCILHYCVMEDEHGSAVAVKISEVIKVWNIALGGEHTRFIKQEGSKVFPVHVQLAQSVLVGVTHLEHVILWKKQRQSEIVKKNQ